MPRRHHELLDALSDAYTRGDADAFLALVRPDALFDRSRSIGPDHGVYTVAQMHHSMNEMIDAWEAQTWELDDREEVTPGIIVSATHVTGIGRESGLHVDSRGGVVVRVRDDRIAEVILFQRRDDAFAFASREVLRLRLLDSHLYLVCDARPHGRDPGPLLEAALEGGVDVIQLRDKDASDEDLLQAAERFRTAADRHGALFFLNDRADLVEPAGADGVHVGQDDIPVAEARALAPAGTLVGLSTHTPEQLRAALDATGEDRPDQISAGPVWETPTKEGRPAAGLGLIRIAAAEATGHAWFAIGGIDLETVGQVREAGTRRIVVVRAIRDAADPATAARELRKALAT